MQNNTNENISAILSIKKSWFKPFKPIKFTLADVSDSEVALFFDEYDEIRYMAEKAEKVILEYLILIKSYISSVKTWKMNLGANCP